MLALHCGGKVLEICALLVKHDRQGDNRLLKIGALLCEALIIRQYVQALSDITMGSLRLRTLAILLMWSRCSSPSPTGADQRCTKENHKILLQFNLHKLYNLCKKLPALILAVFYDEILHKK